MTAIDTAPAFLRRFPAPPLSEFVEFLWFSFSAPAAHAFDHMLPNGDIGIVVNLREDRCSVRRGAVVESYPGAIIAGTSSRPFVIGTAQQCQTVGVKFRLGRAAAFLGVPAGELHNSHLPLADLWKSRASELRERLLAVNHPRETLSVLEQVLSQQLSRIRPWHAGINFAAGRIAAAPGRVSISSLADQTGLTARRFAQLFQAQTGVTPKVFHRLQRFHLALEMIHGKDQVEWTEVALQCGYYDQAHFDHNFREFSGFTPSDYLAAQGEFLHHVPLI